MVDDAAAARRKLGGYLRAVVSVDAASIAAASASIPRPLTPCTLSACGALPLAPLPDDGGASQRNKLRASGGSVVRLLRTLVANRCLEVEGTLLRVVTRRAGEGDADDGAAVEARAVVLLDVYLPVAAWSGWQFPRSRTAATAVFKHVRCNVWCRLPVITPCQHLLCLDCVALDSEKCTLPGCGNHYEMESPKSREKATENPNPKWPVPKDLIELQPSYKQDDWDPDWQSTSSSKVAYLIEKLISLRETGMNYGNNIANSAGQPQAMLDKVIIFSQFLEHIHVIEQQLTIAGITYAGMYSPMHLGTKRSALAKFREDPTCMALVMDGTAALGLDLSFVTHVFLMEPIWDRSMEEQVISRAHRMGATRPIQVETLAMRGTIEEQMLKLLQDSSACRNIVNKVTNSTENEGGRPHRSLHDFAESSYLAQLRFV
nr:unnamed protein product [Digitaria exilis]